jgi:hypothetical protein
LGRPPPKNEPAAGAAYAHGPNDVQEVSLCTDKEPQSANLRKRDKVVPHREFTMTAGQLTIGTIVQRSTREFTALAADGRWLGAFATVKEAMRAVSISHGGGRRG